MTLDVVSLSLGVYGTNCYLVALPDSSDTNAISRPDGEKVHFEVDAFRKHCLLNGLDDIGLTEQKAAEIGTYEEKARLARPWQFGMTQRGA